MTKTIIFTAAAFITLSSGFASTSVSMHDDAVEVSRILLNRQLTDCIVEFQKDDFSINSVTKETAADVTTYHVSGLILQGGDIVVGNGTILIQAKQVPATFGFGTNTLYQCEVQRKLFR